MDTSSEKRPLAGSEPTSADVLVDLLFDDGLLFLVLRNDGARAAEHVRVTFDRPLMGADGVDLSELGVFSHLNYLAPGKRIAVFLDHACAFYARKQRSRLRLEVSWRVGHRRFEAAMNHDLRAYADLPYIAHESDDRRLRRPRR